MKNYVSLVWKWTLDNPKKMDKIVLESQKYCMGFCFAMFFVFLDEGMEFFASVLGVLFILAIINIIKFGKKK